jgi:hypothetical protein
MTWGKARYAEKPEALVAVEEPTFFGFQNS